MSAPTSRNHQDADSVSYASSIIPSLRGNREDALSADLLSIGHPDVQGHAKIRKEENPKEIKDPKGILKEKVEELIKEEIPVKELNQDL